MFEQKKVHKEPLDSASGERRNMRMCAMMTIARGTQLVSRSRGARP